ncbi:MAG: SDR family NAD(P)-dependent oxidoreductase [Kiritimatiellae bacterium]|nr:SDR family NAD(P)-dependent oxidoreductase [Kiritimatiellia bacterium]
MNTLITGASSGIGEALARACAIRGDRLFICGRNAERLAAVAAACRESGAEVHERVLDVTDEDATRRWLQESDAVAPLDRVFSNAGVSTGQENEVNSRRTFAVNVGGCVNTVLPAIAIFRARKPTDGAPVPGHPQIVITASIAGYGPLKACPAYAATKSCVKTWGLSLRGMLASEGIRVSVVCPGFVRSRITDGNTCPMPFFMEADKAASIILRRADRNVGMIAFPWPMRFGAWWISTLPYRVNELINLLLPRKVL